MKRITTVLLTIVLLLCAMTTVAFAQSTNVAEGACGASLNYAVVSNGDQTYTLKITGAGAMNDYSGAAAPWNAYNSKISNIVVADGVTSISSGAFSGCNVLKTVDVAYSVTAIGSGAFPETAQFELYGWLNHASGVYADAHQNVALKLKELRVLTIGNSHTDDYTCYFHNMISDMTAGMDTKIVFDRVIYGGRRLILPEGSTKSHYVASQNPNMPGYQDYQNAFAKTWDVVLVQDYRESVQLGAEFADDMQTAMDWIRSNTPGAKIGWVADWAEPASGYKYETGVAAIKAVQALNDRKPDFIIPLLTIVDNARSSYFGTTMNAKGISSAAPNAHLKALLERDDNHMSLELGRYIAGAGVMYHTVQYFEDMLMLDENFDMLACLETKPVYPDWQGDFIDDYWPVVKETVLNSYRTPLAITQSQYTADPFDAKYAKVKEILDKELPWSVVKERMNGTVVTDDIVAKVNAATGFNLKKDDFTFTLTDGVYTIEVNCCYGYSTPAEDALTVKITDIVNGYYYVNGEKTYGGVLHLDTNNDGKADTYYYARSSGQIVCAQNYTITKTNDLVPQGMYTFAADGEMLVKGVYKVNGTLYYYENGVPTHKGLVYDEAEGCYYYARTDGKIATGEYTIYASRTNGLLPAGTYTFGADGKLFVEKKKDGLVKEASGVYYYENGELVHKGLVYDETEGCYYYIRTNGQAATGVYTIYNSRTNGLLPAGTYDFGGDGRLFVNNSSKNGIVRENGGVYYYENGELVHKGLIYDETEGCYYYIRTSGKAATGEYTIYNSRTNGLLPAGTYNFGSDGRLFIG